MMNASLIRTTIRHGMFIFVVFALGITALIIVVFIRTISEIDALQETPIYRTRQALLSEGERLPPDASSYVSSAIAKDNMADWKTYRNAKYGFEVRYPPYYTLEKKSDDKIRLLESSSYFPPITIYVVKGIREYIWVGKFNHCSFIATERLFRCYNSNDIKYDVYAKDKTQEGDPIYFFEDGDTASFIHDYLIPNYITDSWVILGNGGDRIRPEILDSQGKKALGVYEDTFAQMRQLVKISRNRN